MTVKPMKIAAASHGFIAGMNRPNSPAISVPFRTAMAVAIWRDSPQNTVFQRMARRLEERRYATARMPMKPTSPENRAIAAPVVPDFVRNPVGVRALCGIVSAVARKSCSVARLFDHYQHLTTCRPDQLINQATQRLSTLAI